MSTLIDRLLNWLFNRVIDYDGLLEGALAFWRSIDEVIA